MSSARPLLASPFKAFASLSGATLFAIVLSVLTNKVVAVKAGPEGMGLLGIFSGFAASVGMLLGSGVGIVFTQRLAAANEGETEAIVGAARALILFQTALSAAIAVIFIPALRNAFFAGELAGVTEWQLRAVVLMALVNTILQIKLSILRADRDVRPQAWVNVVTAASSLALIIPLLSLGPVGLAINVGSGGLAGIVLAAHFIRRRYPTTRNIVDSLRYARNLAPSLFSSVSVTLSQLALQFASILVLTEIGKRDVGFLGNFSAALLVVDTLLNVAISPARTLAISHLASCLRAEDRAQVSGYFLDLAFAVGLASSVMLVWLAKPLTAMLFSGDFTLTAGHLTVLAVSLAAQGTSWVFNAMMVSRGEFVKTSLLNAVTALLFAGGSYTVLHFGLGIGAVLWVYVCTHLLGTGLHLIGAFAPEAVRPPVAKAASGFLAAVVLTAAIRLDDGSTVTLKHALLACLAAWLAFSARSVLRPLEGGG